MLAKFFVTIVIALPGNPAPPTVVNAWLPYESRTECVRDSADLVAAERKRLPEAQRGALIQVECHGTPPGKRALIEQDARHVAALLREKLGN